MKSLLFVDDEPRVLQGLQRQLHCMRHEWTMHFADSGAKALLFMESNPVDVIVSDMMMPEMDGAQLLSQVMTRHPTSIRLVLSGHADREAVLRLVGPAHQYLSKPCNPEELRNAIARSFALRDLLSSEHLKQLTSCIRSLPSLPTLHAQLTRELAKEDPSIERIGEIISRDFGMTTKILQLVNSAFFGLQQQAANPTEAVVYLGLTTIRALVVSIQVFSQFDQKTIPGFSIDSLAKHCWMTGVFARRIAQAVGRNPKLDEQCFLAGLLHDVGQLVLAAGLPERYAQVLHQAEATGVPIWEAEKAEFGATHAEVGAYLLGLWGLPNPVVEAVAFHHRPAECVLKEFSAVIAVHAADIFTAHEKSSPAAPALDMECFRALGLEHRLESLKQCCIQDGELALPA